MAVVWKKLAFNEDVITKAASGANTDITSLTGLAQAGMGHSVFIGEYAGLNDDLSDNRNVFIGYKAGTNNTTGNYNSAIGYVALSENTISSYNTALGYAAGRYHADSLTPLTDPENSVYIGALTKGKDNTDNNSIVIGYNAVGLGANTVVLGNDNITTTALKGNVQLNGELNINTHKITGVVDPTSAQDAATKAYGDANWGGGATLPVVDTTGIAKGSADATKIVRFEVDGLTTATTRALTVQDKNYTLADHADLHSEAHNIPSHSDTTATGAQLNTLVGGGETTLHSHAGGGTVDTFGTPVDNDFAKFTDADTIEGRSYSETRTDLGLVIGTNVQAYDADLTTLGGLAKTDSNFIVGNGSAWVAETGSTARTSLGLGSAATRAAEDTMTDGGNLPDGHAVKAYGDANWSGGGSGYEYIVTTKTAAAINTAIDSANTAGGGTVLLSSGEYDCTGTVYVTMKDNVTLSGYGATLKGDGGLSQIIYATGLDNAKILGITINGQSPLSSSSSGEDGIKISTGDNIVVKDCHIHSMSARGISTNALTDVQFVNNHVAACYMGIRISSPISKAIITNNLIEDTYAGGITLFSEYQHTITDIVISNNVVDFSAIGEALGAQNIVCYSAYSGATSGTIRGITVTGNTVIGKGAEAAGIRMGGDQITITGNKIYNTLDGILIRKTNNTAALDPCTNVTVGNNTLKNIKAKGIYIERGEHITIGGNTVHFTSHSAVDVGISIGANYGTATYGNSDIAITNNVIQGTTTSEFGIYCKYTNQLTISGNIIHTVSKDGIRFVDCKYVGCQDNVVYDAGNGSTGYGVHLLGTGDNISDYIIVANNQLNGNPDGALINASAGTHMKIYNNHGNNDYLGGGGCTYNDNDHLYLGTGNDLDIYHSGTNSYIINKTGSLGLYANATDYGIRIVSNAQVDLYFNNIRKFYTGSAGCYVDGVLDMKTHKIVGVVDPTTNQEAATKKYVDDNIGGGGLNNVVEDLTPQLGGNLDCTSKNLTGVGNTYQADSKVAYFGTGNDMYIYHNGAAGYLVNTAGSLHINANAADSGIRVVSDAQVDLYFNGIRKAWTTTVGFEVDGIVTASCGSLTCDYVFEDDYNLMPLDDLQDFIRTKKKLPHMTIGKGGSYSTATLRTELVEKIEEQASYILQLHERLKVLENK